MGITKEVFLIYFPGNRAVRGDYKATKFYNENSSKKRISPEYWLHTAGKGLTGLKFWKRGLKFENGTCHYDVYAGK